MSDKIIIGPNLMGPITYQELPIGCTFIGRAPFTIPTGLWRFNRPAMNKKTSPCNKACLVGGDVRGWITHARDGDFDRACQLLLEENPFPGVCGRVCSHPCESSCNRIEYDEALSIRAIERFIGDWAIEHDYEISPVSSKKKKRVAIVGSGPSGLAGAYHLARMGYGVKVYEALPALGGMPRVGIPEYRLPKSVLDAEISRIQGLGVEMETNVRIGKDISLEDLKKEYDAVLLAVGFEISKGLRIPGEDSLGVYHGLELLKGINQRETPNLKGRVAVIGGGNAAIDSVRTALRLGAEEAFIVYRRSIEEMPANEEEIEEAEEEGIKIHYLLAPVRILGKDGRVVGLECIRMKLEEPDGSGRRRPIPIEDSGFVMDVDAVILAIGQSIDTAFMSPEVGLKLNKGDTIEIDSVTHATDIPGIFAVGDAATGAGSVGAAIASGKRAAIFVDQYLSGEEIEGLDEIVTIGSNGAPSIANYLERYREFNEKEKKVIGFDDLNTVYFENQEREKVEQLSINDRKKTFKEVNLTLSGEAVLREADRCFTCGDCTLCDTCFVFCPDMSILKSEDKTRNEIDYKFCKGCGICINECPRGYIDLEKET